MSETEKVTVNVGVVDLGKIDLLVSEGFYSNRTDIIRTAIRNQLMQHSEEVKQTVISKEFLVGVRIITKEELDQLSANNERKVFRVVGMVKIDDDVSLELAKATIESMVVFGVLRAGKTIKEELLDF
jgi:Arc/MetJ-type ribon-helix-helix transcriptional regulator